ncbi:molybdopterin biosynthesis protein MoeY, partial [Acinetobacter baumannii]|nr:molybdopterin biosynthesis protein MoeY [Acinetobacter baumannii]
LARWAPSGDNTQPWRFELAAPDHVVVHASDTRSDTVYDLDGHPSQISVGALLETMCIAASVHGLRAEAQRRAGSPEQQPLFDV